MTNGETAFATDETRWAAVMRRDRAFDGRFVTGVLSTGIYCRPSCAARHPARRNVRFFADGAQAQAAGLRPCKRCLPDDVARDEAAVHAAFDAIRAGTVRRWRSSARSPAIRPRISAGCSSGRSACRPPPSRGP